MVFTNKSSRVGSKSDAKSLAFCQAPMKLLLSQQESDQESDIKNHRSRITGVGSESDWPWQGVEN
jgi:hypothetical protein